MILPYTTNTDQWLTSLLYYPLHRQGPIFCGPCAGSRTSTFSCPNVNQLNTSPRWRATIHLIIQTLCSPLNILFPKIVSQKSHRQSLNHYLPLSLSLSMALFESFDDVAERLTARACTFLIGAHGPHFIGRYYLWKGQGTPNLDLFRVCYLLIRLQFTFELTYMS